MALRLVAWYPQIRAALDRPCLCAQSPDASSRITLSSYIEVRGRAPLTNAQVRRGFSSTLLAPAPMRLAFRAVARRALAGPCPYSQSRLRRVSVALSAFYGHCRLVLVEFQAYTS